MPLIYINHHYHNQNKESVNFPVLWSSQPYFSTYQHEVFETEYTISWSVCLYHCNDRTQPVSPKKFKQTSNCK